MPVNHEASEFINGDGESFCSSGHIRQCLEIFGCHEGGSIGISSIEAMNAAKTFYTAQNRPQQRINLPKVSAEPRLKNHAYLTKKVVSLGSLLSWGVGGKSKVGKAAPNLSSLNTNPHSCGEECLLI